MMIIRIILIPWGHEVTVLIAHNGQITVLDYIKEKKKIH